MKTLPPVLFVALIALIAPDYSHASVFRAGAAKVDTTPQTGVSLNGPISKPGAAKGVHDRLHARALVLANDKVRLAIVVCDNCMIGGDVIDAAKKRVHETSGFPIDHILVSATHTHAAPRATHIGTNPVDDEYHLRLSEWIARAILDAEKKLTPARIGHTSFERPELLKCRRDLCEPGSAGPNPFGETNERVSSVSGRSSARLGPAGPVDPEFSVVSIQRTDGTPICVLGNFSVHYCGGYSGGLISADYFGYFAEAIEARLGGDSAVVGIMSNGTSGNTGSFTRNGKKHHPFEGMQIYGRMLAQDAIKAIDAIEYREDVEIQMLERQIDLAVRKPDSARLAWADKVLADEETKHPHNWTRIYATEAKYLSRFPETRRMTLQAIKIGTLAIAASPCETFAETGLAIKRASPHQHTFTIELANGYGGYLPPREQHELGGYETWPARSSFLEIDAEQKIREELVQLLTQLTSPNGAEPQSDGYVSLFNGKNLDGWQLRRAERRGYVVENGQIVCPAGEGGYLFTDKEYSDFSLKMEFQLSTAANSGVAIRCPLLDAKPAYEGTEIQILDNIGFKGTLRPTQAHGSIYDVVPAKRGALKPAGEWNEQEIIWHGRTIKVVCNGQVLVDANLDTIDADVLNKHPGLSRKRGHIALLGHNDRVAFRNIRIKELPPVTK